MEHAFPATGPEAVSGIADTQRTFFRTGLTRETEFRRQQLQLLREAVVAGEDDLLAAMREDLGRCDTETYGGEIAVVLKEIDAALRSLSAWARPRRVHSPMTIWPASSAIHPEPYGSVLVVAPWNYPFQLLFAPIVAALAAGNCVVAKPSELAPATSRVSAKLIRETFDPQYVAVFEGGVEPTQALLKQKFDYIFFTGGTAIGKIVMAAAAEHLTPVTLELGGKNPCIIDVDANIQAAAKRIVWGKFFNAGQTCIAPDYLLVHQSVKPALLEGIASEITAFYGADAAASPDYARIINERHFDRLAGLIENGGAAIGGKINWATRYIAPTVIDNVAWDHPAMKDEIFGPVLPVLTYDDLDDALATLQEKPKPLAAYFFSKDRSRQEKFLSRISAGGVCINDVFAQFLNMDLPFGGVGDSGMGAYHGRSGFDTFSHMKAVVRRGLWPDPSFKYPPYGISLKMLRRLTPRWL